MAALASTVLILAHAKQHVAGSRLAAVTPLRTTLSEFPEPAEGSKLQEHFTFALASFHFLIKDKYPEDPRDLSSLEDVEPELNRELTMAQALRHFALCSSLWQRDDFACLMQGYLSAVHARQEPISDETKRSKGPPPQAPHTMFDLVVDAIPTYDGLRAFYFACWQRPADVLAAVHRCQRWHEYYGDADDATLVPFKEQADRIVGAFVSIVFAKDDAYYALKEKLGSSEPAVSYGATRPLPHAQVTDSCVCRPSGERI
jgi:hypothetical protein